MAIRKYTNQEIINESLKYDSLKEFKLANSAFYWSAYEYKLIDVIRNRMTENKKNKQIKLIKNIAAKFKHIKDFRKNHPDLYKLAYKFKILGDVCCHMIKLKQNRSLISIHREALKYKTKKEFQIGSPNDCQAAHKKGIIGKVCSHMESSLIYWTKESLGEEALRFSNRTDFSKKSSGYQAAWKMGILDEICKHMGANLVYRTNEDLLGEAIKYKTKIDFYINSPNAYAVAHKRGIISEICSHMPKNSLIGSTPVNFKWSNEEMKKEALKHESLGDFRINAVSAYKKAVKLNIISEVCAHMEKPYSSSSYEFHLLNTIRTHYPKAQKIRKNKIKIENKPHITGLELDIYIPEVRKGIEFDGTFHHSFAGLKRGRPNWSDADIHNYHKIKDDYFLSVGISIIHVSETDWIENRETCIQKCLQFLGSSNELLSTSSP